MFKSNRERSSRLFLVCLAYCSILAPILARAATVDRVLFVMPYGEAISETYLRSQINLAAGVQFTPERLSDDIQRLYDTGIIADLEAEVEPSQEGRVNVRFRVQPTAEISDIEIVGNRQVKSSRLLAQLELESGQRLNTGLLTEGRNQMRQLYRDRGFHQAQVEIRQIAEDDGRVRLRVEIDEESRHKIRRTSFVGNQAYSDRRLRRNIRSRRNLWAYLFRTGFLSAEQLERDRESLRELYHDLGYLDFEIERVEREYSANDKWVDLTFHLREGAPYEVENVEVVGNQEFPDQDLEAGLSLRESMVYSLSAQRRDLEWMRGLYNQRGFLDSRIMPRLDQNADDQTVQVEYSIVEGQSARIRDIFIVGNVITQDRVLRREVALQPGDLADGRQIEATRSRLSNLQYFETVRVTPLPTEREDEKDLEIAVEERMTGRWGIGGGVSSDTGLFGFFEVQDTNFDISKLFRFRDWPPKGAGQRASLRANLGTDVNEFVISFVEPWLLGYRLRLQTDLHMRTFDQSEYDEERLGGSVGLTRMVSLGPDRQGRRPWWRGDWRQSAGLRLEQVKLTGFSAGASPELLAEEGSYTVSAVNFGLSRDTRDSFTLPTSGSTLGINLEVQSEILGAYSNLYKLDLRGSHYLALERSPWLDRMPVLGDSILKLSGEIGNVESISGDDPAIFDRYFAGGQYSFRGFRYRKVSPADINGDPVGGRSRLLGTVEVMYPMHETVWISLFCDFGNAWRGSWDWDPADLNSSVGIGLQLDLRVIPIRIDYGHPIITRQEHLKKSGELHFSLGRSF